MPSFQEYCRRKKFPKKIRIKKNHEFGEIFKKGKRIKGFSVDIYILKQSESNRKSFGIAISKKIKGAVNRNRYKRIIREIIRSEKPHFQFGIKMIVLMKREFKKKEYRIIRNEFLSMLSQEWI